MTKKNAMNNINSKNTLGVEQIKVELSKLKWI